jgi:hypothetical protein
MEKFKNIAMLMPEIMPEDLGTDFEAEWLTLMGNNGWQLTSVVSRTFGSKTSYVYYFTRLKENTPPSSASKLPT